MARKQLPETSPEPELEVTDPTSEEAETTSPTPRPKRARHTQEPVMEAPAQAKAKAPRATKAAKVAEAVTFPKGTYPLSIAQQYLMGYVQAHPGCGKSEAARAASFGQGDSTWRERMRTIAAFEGRGYLVNRSREAAKRHQVNAMYVTPKGARVLAATEAKEAGK